MRGSYEASLEEGGGGLVSNYGPAFRRETFADECALNFFLSDWEKKEVQSYHTTVVIIIFFIPTVSASCFLFSL